MSHVTVLELHQFVTRAESSAEFDSHVSSCAACASKLSAFARRAVAPVPVEIADEPRRLATVVMAFAACVAVMAMQAVPKFEVPASSPEGVHGVSRSEPRVEAFVFEPADSGVDSGVR